MHNQRQFDEFHLFDYWVISDKSSNQHILMRYIASFLKKPAIKRLTFQEQA